MHKKGADVLRVISIFLFSIFVMSQASAEQSQNYEKVVDAVAFKSKIVGTTWAYRWRDREYVFSLSPDGSIGKLNSWSGVSWVVDQPREVILDAGSQQMYLFFNSEASSFKTVDWDGQRATGVRVFEDYQ